MKKILLAIGIFYCGTFCIAAASDSGALSDEEKRLASWGEVQTPEGIKFVVNEVGVREWIKSESSGLGKMTAVTYSIINQTGNKKIDLSAELAFILTDEFGNVYQRLEKPLNYGQPITVPGENFPSLYPDEQFTASIFFEAPVAASQVLNLVVDAKSIGVGETISLHLPVVRALPAKTEEEIVFKDEDLQISVPKRLHRILPGDIIPIKVTVSEKIRSPDSIYIITPFYLHEDQDALGNYELRIPANQPDGPITVIVLSRWSREGQDATLSKSFTVNIKRPQTRCTESSGRNCARTGGLAKKNPSASSEKF